MTELNLEALKNKKLVCDDRLPTNRSYMERRKHRRAEMAIQNRVDEIVVDCFDKEQRKFRTPHGH